MRAFCSSLLRGLTAFVIVAFIAVDAAVTLKNSQVLGPDDFRYLPPYSPSFDQGGLPIQCLGGCTVYATAEDDSLAVGLLFNGVIQSTTKDHWRTFKTIESDLDELGHMKGIKLENVPPKDGMWVVFRASSKSGTGVLYAVHQKVSEADDSVVVLFKRDGQYNVHARYVTILSFESPMFSIHNMFGERYVKIYATGVDFEASGCRAIYDSREMDINEAATSILVIGPIATIDFYNPQNYDHLFGLTGNDPGSSVVWLQPGASRVHSSPGYVGCSLNQGQQYYSAITDPLDYLYTIDSFVTYKFDADLYLPTEYDSLWFFGDYGEFLNLYGTAPTQANISTQELNVKWARRNKQVYFSVQIDVPW